MRTTLTLNELRKSSKIFNFTDLKYFESAEISENGRIMENKHLFKDGLNHIRQVQPKLIWVW